MKIGDIDVPNSILDLEHRLIVMEQYVNYIIQNNRKLNQPNHVQFEQFRDNAISVLQKKYPSMGIKKKI